MSSDAVALGVPLARGLGTAESIQWPLRRSSELFELRYGKALVEADRRPGNVPVYGTNGRTGTHDRALFSGPGVVLGRKGMGNLGVEWVDEPFWVIDTAYALFPLVEIDLKFAYYLIRHVGLNHLKHGTSNPSLTREAFGAQLFPVPPLGAQQLIAAVLGSLDDKIASNDRLRIALDRLIAGCYEDAARSVADRRPLSEVASHHKASLNPASTPATEYEHFSIPAFDSARLSEVALGAELLSSKYTLPATAVAVSRLNPMTKRVLLHQSVTALPSICSSEFVVLTPDTDMSAEVLYAMVAHDRTFYADLLAGVTGTTGSRQRVKPNDVLSSSVPAFSLDRVRSLTRTLTPLVGLYRHLHSESQRLRALGEALLPKLVSGQLRLPGRTPAWSHSPEARAGEHAA